MTLRKFVMVSALFFAAALPVSLLFPTNAQLNVRNGALTGVTTMPSYFPMGEISFATNASATDITVQGTYVKVAGTSTLSSGVTSFDMPENNRLRYTGATTIMAHVACTFSYTVASGSNQELAFRVYKNGNPLAASEVRDTCSAATGSESTAIHIMVELAQNEYLELWGGQHLWHG
jgi:hypothetical protein